MTAVQIAIGRLLRMMARPVQDGDIQTYYQIRDIVMAARDEPIDHAPNWQRDRLKGAQGD